ncbi:hypothetical protein LCGC14_3146040 [marine sediment metagenome]|uniref:Uncharacterized protein n=1 Tax=marine sediment metagenome TaxID=412755 RepID=A0A0F8VVK4_9ZZZZ
MSNPLVAKQRRLKERLIVLAALGNRCACCGEKRQEYDKHPGRRRVPFHWEGQMSSPYGENTEAVLTKKQKELTLDKYLSCVDSIGVRKTGALSVELRGH